MLLYPLPALLTPFPALITPFSDITFIIKGNANNGRNLPLFPFPVIAFIKEETEDCINGETISAIKEAAIGAIIPLRNPPSCFFISCFTVSVAPPIDKLVFSSDPFSTV